MTRIAAVFPGQGSQSPGMLASLAADWPQVKETFAEASDALGHDLWEIVSDNPGDRLNQTLWTQPVMLAAGIATARTWNAAGGAVPMVTAGHSLGEYSALVLAGVLDFGDAIRLVHERARLMQEAVATTRGGMAAILGLEDERIAELCEAVSEGIVEPVNYNAPGQVVIAGEAVAVTVAVEAARAAGAKRAVPLAVSVPAHSSLMQPAAEALAEVLAGVEIRTPSIPVIHNVDAERHESPGDIREALRRQLYNPVRWTDSVAAMKSEGAELVLELGPGRVLSGLMRRIDRNLGAAAIDDPDSLARALETAGGAAT